MRQDRIRLLEETLELFRDGRYECEGKPVVLPQSEDELKTCTVYLDDSSFAQAEEAGYLPYREDGRCEYSCENIDTYGMARKWIGEGKIPADESVAVLNFANAVHPGGGVRKGASAQEENLCCESSLLLSLESAQADPYYTYNWNLHSYMGSDAIIVTPEVLVIRDGEKKFLPEPVRVSVITCAAPNITWGMEGMSRQEYMAMFRKRIEAVLRCCAALRYRHIVLGAWGCGAFGNDAVQIAGLFHEVLDTFRFSGYTADQLYARIGFAVLVRRNTYNFDAFNNVFGKKEEQPKSVLAAIRSRHSTRIYRNGPIAADVLEKILEAGRLAPSSRNLKPCRLITTEDRETLAKLAQAKKAGGAFLSKAAAAITVTASENISDTWIEDCSIAMSYMQLAAEELNVGSCWVQIHLRKDADGNDAEDNVRRILGLSADMRIVGILSLGLPA